MIKQIFTIGLIGILISFSHHTAAQLSGGLIKTTSVFEDYTSYTMKPAKRPTEAKQKMVASAQYAIEGNNLELKDSVLYFYSSLRGSYPEYVSPETVSMKSDYDSAVAVYSIDSAFLRPFLKSTQRFNNDNLLVKGYNFNIDGDTLKTTTITYHVNGNVQRNNSMEIFPLQGNGDEYMYIDKHYNTNGDIIKDTFMQYMPSMSYYWWGRGATSSYDSQNRRTYFEVSRETFGTFVSNFQSKSWSFYTGTSVNKDRDSFLRIDIQPSFSKYDSFNTLYIYSSTGNVLEEVSVDFNTGDSLSKIVYQYNSNDEQVLQATFSYEIANNNWQETFRVESEYDNSNNKIAQLNYYWNTNTNQLILNSKNQYFYNTRNLLDSVYAYNMDWQSQGLRISNITRYWYNNFDNIIQKEFLSYDFYSPTATNSHTVDHYYYEDYLSIDNTNNSVLNVQVYPNPVIDIITVKIDEPGTRHLYDIAIYDLTGKFIKKHSLSVKEMHIDISDIISGIYLLEIIGKQNDKKYVQRIIKK
jgi:hypothetical protein